MDDDIYYVFYDEEHERLSCGTDREAVLVDVHLDGVAAGRREAHDKLMEIYHRLHHAGKPIPGQLRDYYQAYLDNEYCPPKGLRKSQYEEWHTEALWRILFQGAGETRQDIANDLGVSLNTLNVFLRRYRERHKRT